jgi:hypothetical protein
MWPARSEIVVDHASKVSRRELNVFVTRGLVLLIEPEITEMRPLGRTQTSTPAFGGPIDVQARYSGASPPPSRGSAEERSRAVLTDAPWS